MTPRTHLTDYAGARTRLTLEQVERLGKQWKLQPKMDGMYVHVSTDAQGRISALRTRNGNDVYAADQADLVGCFVGWPHSVLAGELEAQTEVGIAARARRGYPLVHLFDCVRAGGRYLGRSPYSARLDTLWRMQSEVCNLSPRVHWDIAGCGRGRSIKTGQYSAKVPRDWRRCPIVPLTPLRGLGELWCAVEARQLEGAVAVNMAAPLGARGSKRKVKPTETLDCTVISADKKLAEVMVGHARFVVSCRKMALAMGDVVEVAVDGWREGGVRPVFPRILRRRVDL